ncbi:hypothetical protein GCM10028784_08360 [Myceligenerans cantabricum]
MVRESRAGSSDRAPDIGRKDDVRRGARRVVSSRTGAWETPRTVGTRAAAGDGEETRWRRSGDLLAWTLGIDGFLRAADALGRLR